MNEILVGTKSGDIECHINSEKDISDQSAFAVKGLAGIQLMCIQQSMRDDPNFGEMIKILTKCVQDIETLYFGERDEPDPIEDYTD